MSRQKRLIIIDGIPGSGKTTTAKKVLDRLNTKQIRTQCLLEQQEFHPLLLNDIDYNSLQTEEGADLYIQLLTSRFNDFVKEQLTSTNEAIIIESVLFQDAINVSHLNGMNQRQLLNLCSQLQRILEPLNPCLIYYYQMNVEEQWRFICNVRGNEWGPVSLHTDEDFKQAGEVWAQSQTFVRAVVDEWEIPKLIIENTDYLWHEYTHRIFHFLDELLNLR